MIWMLLAGVIVVLAGMRQHPRFAQMNSSDNEAVFVSPSVISPEFIQVDTLQLDRETNLVIDERLNLVKAHCTACHSSKLIIQSHLTRDGWRQKIRWMQRTQKLWDLGESEPVVLDYLVKYYGPEDRSFDGRRLPLPKQKW